MKNKFEIRGDTTAILLQHKGEIVETLIETADLDLVDSFSGTWGVSVSRTGKCLTARIAITVERGAKHRNRRWIRLHQVIVPTYPPFVVDHINHNTLDNRRSNLRAVSPSINGLNRRGPASNNKSGILGVSWDDVNNAWSANIKINGASQYLGWFRTAQEAEAAYRAARERHITELSKDSRHAA